MTIGAVYPGHYISIFCSGEYNLNKQWALAFDSNFQYNFKGRFLGKQGVRKQGEKALVTSSEATHFTLAPEVEYTLTESTGMLIGAWVSVIGKNTPAFASMFIAFLHVF